MTDNEKAAILRELAEMVTLPSAEPDEFTAREMAGARGCTYAQAQTVLDRLLGLGHVTRREVQIGGHRVWAYRRANG